MVSMTFSDESLTEGMLRCGQVRLVAMNDHDVLQAHDAVAFYKGHLSIIYDRVIGTGKGMKRACPHGQVKE